jgi:hypothetical protein
MDKIKKLCILNIQDTEGMMVGIPITGDAQAITMNHVCSVVAVRADKTVFSSYPVPLFMAGEGIGIDCETTVNEKYVAFKAFLPLVADSPHPLVQQFIAYWELEL